MKRHALSHDKRRSAGHKDPERIADCQLRIGLWHWANQFGDPTAVPHVVARAIRFPAAGSTPQGDMLPANPKKQLTYKEH